MHIKIKVDICPLCRTNQVYKHTILTTVKGHSTVFQSQDDKIQNVPHVQVFGVFLKLRYHRLLISIIQFIPWSYAQVALTLSSKSEQTA